MLPLSDTVRRGNTRGTGMPMIRSENDPSESAPAQLRSQIRDQGPGRIQGDRAGVSREIDRGLQFFERPGLVAALRKSDAQIVVSQRVFGSVAGRLLECLDRLFVVPEIEKGDTEVGADAGLLRIDGESTSI